MLENPALRQQLLTLHAKRPRRRLGSLDMRRVIFEPDANFNAEVVATVEDYGIRPIRTAFRSPWQNGVAERWVGSVRRDLLNHVIVLNERHLRR
jgi:hypothetical protein